jgi:O-antigen/teichoic acid export membrane protein
MGHGLTAAALPVLTRLYSPADFGLLAVFVGVVSMISVAICLRFDIAVALPERDVEALSLLALAGGTALVVALLIAAVILAAPEAVAGVLSQRDLESHLWLVPVSAFFAGICSALQMWFVRKKTFALIAKSRVSQSAAGAGTQIGLGVLTVGTIGLLIGQALSFIAASVVLAYRFFRETPLTVMKEAIAWRQLKSTFHTYDRFPKYSTFEALCNSVSIQLPIIMIAAMAAPAEAGFLMMAMYAMQAPMALIGGAIAQVYLSRAAEEHREGRLQAYTVDVLQGLVKTGVGPLLAVGILAPVVFEPVFGAGWQRAGVLVAWMTPWFVMQFLASPISMTLHVTGHQSAALLLQLAGLTMRVASVWLAAQLATNHLAETYAVTGLVFYSLYLMTVLHYVRLPWHSIFGLFGKGLRPILFFLVPSALAAWALRQFLAPL